MLHFETLARLGMPVDAGSGGTFGESLMPPVAQGRHNLRPPCLCGAPGLVQAAAALITPAYVATVELVVNPTGLNLVVKDLILRPEAIDSGASALEMQFKILSSDKVLSRVIAQIHLDDNPTFKCRPFWRDGGILERAPVTLGAATGTGDESRSQSALDRLRTMVTLRRTERAFVIDIVIRTPNPELSTDDANAVSDAYLTDRSTMRSDATDQVASMARVPFAALAVSSPSISGASPTGPVSPDFGAVMVTTVGLLFVTMRATERTRLHDRTHGRPLPRAARYRVRGAIATFGAGRASAASTDAGAVTPRAADPMGERECHVP